MKPIQRPASSLQPPEGIDAEAFCYAMRHLTKPHGKLALRSLAEYLKGIALADFQDVLGSFLGVTGRRRIGLGEFQVITGWFRAGYSVRVILLGVQQARENAEKAGGVVISPNYVTPNIHQIANSSTERDLRTGGRR